MTDKRNGSAKMQSCSKRNELPLSAKLCVRFLFLIHAEYSKVSSFFFCAEFDLRGVWPAPSLTCAEFDLRRVWPAPSLTCAEFDLRRVWPAQSLTCAEFDLRRVWPAQSLTCAEFDLRRVWPAPKCPAPSLLGRNVVNRSSRIQVFTMPLQFALLGDYVILKQNALNITQLLPRGKLGVVRTSLLLLTYFWPTMYIQLNCCDWSIPVTRWETITKRLFDLYHQPKKHKWTTLTLSAPMKKSEHQ